MSERLESAQLCCPNCGQRNRGYKNAKGIVLLRCRKCGSCISSRKMKETQKAVITISQQN